MSAPPPPLSLRLYRLATALAEPLAPLLLAARVRRGKEARERLGERLGRPGRARPPGGLVWLHGASVGESLSLLPLVERIGAERPDLAVLVTSGTRTSADLLAERLPAGVIHQYVPVDGPAAVARFLDHWRPDLALFTESELWPNLILGARRSGVRLALVSARITEASARGWARRPHAAQAVFGAFEAILAQDDLSRARIEALGGRVTGSLNLKRLGSPLAADEAELAALRAAVGRRRVVFAASTHPGEEIPVAAAVSTLADYPLLIIAPRHPERGDAVAAELRRTGLEVAQRSKVLPPRGRGTTRSVVEGVRSASASASETSANRQTGAAGGGPPPPPFGGPPPPTGEDLGRADIYLADTLGEMGLFYRLADVVVMGGSFVAGLGGHNPLEAARLGVGVVTGPHVFNYADIYAEMAAAGAALMVEDAPGLARELGLALAAPERLRELGARARAFAEAQAAGFEDGWRMIAPLLPAP